MNELTPERIEELDGLQTPPTELEIAAVLSVLPDGPARHVIRRLVSERDKLQAFKDWTHRRPDALGVPHHPPGVHGEHGCRIGDRMDWLEAERARLHQALAVYADKGNWICGSVFVAPANSSDTHGYELAAAALVTPCPACTGRGLISFDELDGVTTQTCGKCRGTGKG